MVQGGLGVDLTSQSTKLAKVLERGASLLVFFGWREADIGKEWCIRNVLYDHHILGSVTVDSELSLWERSMTAAAAVCYAPPLCKANAMCYHKVSADSSFQAPSNLHVSLMHPGSHVNIVLNCVLQMHAPLVLLNLAWHLMIQLMMQLCIIWAPSACFPCTRSCHSMQM